MEHYEFSNQFRRPRKSKKRRRAEMISTFIMAVATFAVTAAIFVMMFDVWANHPAERPISGQAYMASLQNGGEAYGLDR